MHHPFTTTRRERTDTLWMRIIAGFFVFDIIIVSALFIKFFYSGSAVPVAVASSVNIDMPSVGPDSDLNVFISHLTGSNLSVGAMKPVSRKNFTVGGEMVVMNGDNIQVFEYGDHTGALGDATSLAAKYLSSWRSASWKKNIHLYVDGKFVVFYMGSHADILGSLEQNAGLSMMDTSQSSQLLTKSTQPQTNQ